MKKFFDQAMENCAEEGAWTLQKSPLFESRGPRADLPRVSHKQATGSRLAPGWKLGAIGLSLAAALLLSSTAHAATLKADGLVSGETITVGDVFDGAGKYADRYLAPTPVVGESLSLNAHDLKRISDAFELGWTPEAQGAHVTLRRKANVVDRYAIEGALQQALAEQMDGRRFDMELDDKSVFLVLPEKAEKTVSASEIRLDLQKNSFSAILAAPGDSAPVTKEVSGRLYLLEKVPVLKAAAQAGDIIGADDIDYVDMRTSDLSASIVIDAGRIIGHTPRRTITAMRPLNAADIVTQKLVKKGDIVTVALQSGALGLSMQGRALQNGAIGETVNIVNTASNRQLEAVVTGMQSVSLKLPSAM